MMKHKAVSVFLVLTIFTFTQVHSIGIILGTLHNAAQETKCGLHKLGNKIFHHGHQHEPCEAENHPGENSNGPYDPYGNNQNSGYDNYGNNRNTDSYRQDHRHGHGHGHGRTSGHNHGVNRIDNQGNYGNTGQVEYGNRPSQGQGTFTSNGQDIYGNRPSQGQGTFTSNGQDIYGNRPSQGQGTFTSSGQGSHGNTGRVDNTWNTQFTGGIPSTTEIVKLYLTTTTASPQIDIRGAGTQENRQNGTTKRPEGKRVINVRTNCQEGFRADEDGICREEY